MKMTVTETIFRDYFNRSQFKNHFSYMGLKKLFEILEDDEIWEDQEFCMYSICEEYSEYDTLKEFTDQYDDDPEFTYWEIDNERWSDYQTKVATKSYLIRHFG